jgi:acetate kinase
VFAHRARKYLGAYAAVMGGLDAVVLTGGIGENASAMRRRILQRLDFLGLVLDEEANDGAKVTSEKPVVRVSAPNSRVAALVVKTNEELSIARQTVALVQEKVSVKPGRTIPIAVSARHVHLDEVTFAQLFGVGAKPTKLRDISQPGQYACEEKVNLIGPRSRIDGVRVLGPLRKACQVEVSRSDEFSLGVDAPIRDSGNTTSSAPITLEGPKGTVNLREGLICAKRHIHMAPEDATAFGVTDGDEVEVAITGGPRDLVFGDVLVRVSEKYKLEMHLDTDEANAAELSQGAQGEVTYTDVLGATAKLQKRRHID